MAEEARWPGNGWPGPPGVELLSPCKAPLPRGHKKQYDLPGPFGSVWHPTIYSLTRVRRN